jgi:ferredoxin-type protein NapG
MSPSPDQAVLDRRAFTALGLGALGAVALGFWAVPAGQSAGSEFRHRPPGAGGLRQGGQTDPASAERRFLAQCIRCGQCAVPCPEQTVGEDRRRAIRFYGIASGPLAGTPFIAPRQAPCLMCVDVPCVRACPTGALDPALEQIAEARMGTACIVDRAGCLALQGLRCEVCYDRCPVRGHALTLERQLNARTGVHTVLEPVVHPEACTGCGICEHVCPRDEAVIKVVRRIPAPRDGDGFYQFKGTRPG